MWYLRKPNEETIQRFTQDQARQPFSYPEVGATADELPAGYDHDHNRVKLGAGQAVFDAACDALRRWQQFPAPLAAIHPASAPLQPGCTVAIVARAGGLWWLNACRIIYVVDDVSPIRRFGFAYGTLPEHVESGEERFCIEWLADDSVWYDIRAFSRPRRWMTRLAYPLARRVQRRFAAESKAAMARMVSEAALTPARG
jgi:uncharacterized protein (UPF0548 family)